MSRIDHILNQEKKELPEIVEAAGSYLTYVRNHDLIFISGQLPRVADTVKYVGKVGSEVGVDDAMQAARLCALRILAIVKQAAGSLDSVSQVVELTVFINSAPNFIEQSRVADAASQLMEDVLGARGRHARSAVGVAQLPKNAAVEVKAIVALIPQP